MAVCVCGGCCEGQGASHKQGCKTLIKLVRMKKSEDSLSWCRTNTQMRKQTQPDWVRVVLKGGQPGLVSGPAVTGAKGELLDSLGQGAKWSTRYFSSLIRYC